MIYSVTCYEQTVTEYILLWIVEHLIDEKPIPASIER